MHPDVRVTGSWETPPRFSPARQTLPLFSYYSGSLFSVLFTYTPSEVWRRFVQSGSSKIRNGCGISRAVHRDKEIQSAILPTRAHCRSTHAYSKQIQNRREPPMWSRSESRQVDGNIQQNASFRTKERGESIWNAHPQRGSSVQSEYYDRLSFTALRDWFSEFCRKFLLPATNIC